VNALLTRLLVCISLFCGTLFFYLDRHNRVTQLQLELPNLQAELQAIEEKNARYSYEIECFENPARLMELLRQPEFRHLKHPPLNEVLILRRGSDG
jgi:hypothetical protein